MSVDKNNYLISLYAILFRHSYSGQNRKDDETLTAENYLDMITSHTYVCTHIILPIIIISV